MILLYLILFYFFKHNFVNGIMLFFVLVASSQVYYPRLIGESKITNKNINHSDGANLQDVKKSSGFFIEFKNNNLVNQCSFTLVNNIEQNSTPYIITANHCLNKYNQNDSIDSYFSFNYEIENAIERGNKEKNEEISRIHRVIFQVLFNNTVNDVAIIKIIENEVGLFDNAYLSGWDNRITSPILSNISHPKGDHKKVFTKPKSYVFKYLKQTSSGTERKGFSYFSANNWNNILTSPEHGSSGSGIFSDKNLLKALLNSILQETNNGYSRSLALLNNWYGYPGGLNNFSKYLDPNTTWLNYIPGGYFNDLIYPDSNERFELQINPREILSTPSVDVSAPTTLDKDVFHLYHAVVFGNLGLKKKSPDPYDLPIWTTIRGIKALNFNNSDLVLSVFSLKQDKTTGLYSDQLLFGMHATQNSSYSEPKVFGFSGEPWNCKENNLNYPPCNRTPVANFMPLDDNSMDFKRNYLATFINNIKGFFIPLSKASIPIKIQLKNIGTQPVNVVAISYPGEVPLNALQLFKPDEVLSKFKSKKYRPSRGNSTENLYINSFELKQDNKLIRKLETGNNGGYLNLVNNNFKFETVTPSYTTNTENINKSLDFSIALEKGANPIAFVYYKIWIDYSSTTDIDHYYNFEEESHNGSLIELIASGSTSSSLIEGSYTLPYNTELNIAPGESKTYRLRIAVSNTNNISQDGIYDHGEVEDYLIKIQAPTEAEIIAESATIAIPVRSGDQSGIDESPCGVPSEDPAPSPVAAPVNVGDATFPYSCNNFVCSETNCDTNAVNSTTPLEGNYSICISGLNDYIALDQGGTLLHEAFNKRTISFWLNNNTNNIGIESVYDEGGSTEGGMGIRINNDTEQMEVGVRNGANLQTISATIPSSPWIHVVAIFDNGTLSLYQNGTLTAQNNNIGFSTVPLHTDEAGFGGTNGTNVFNELNKSYNGCADEIMIFQESLDTQQVLELYNAYGTGTSIRVAAKQQIVDSNPLVVFPNPTKGDINIIIELKQASNIELKIIDLAGKEVVTKEYKQVGEGHQLIQLRDLGLNSGVYVVKIVTNMGEQTQKLVVE